MTSAACRTAVTVMTSASIRLSWHTCKPRHEEMPECGCQAWCGTTLHSHFVCSCLWCTFHCCRFSTGSWQGSGGIKAKTHRLKCEAVPSVFAWSTTVKTCPWPRERSLLGLPAEVRVAMCATEVDTHRAELAQTRKDVKHTKEETVCLRTQVLWFENLLKANKVHLASGKKGEQASVFRFTR